MTDEKDKTEHGPWEDYASGSVAVSDEHGPWEDYGKPTEEESTSKVGTFQTKKGGPIRQAAGFSEKGEEAPPEHTLTGTAREGALGLSSGFTGMPESEHPIRDWWENLKTQEQARAAKPFSWDTIKDAVKTGIPAIGVAQGLASGVGEMGSGAAHLNPEEFAHGAGSTVGQAAALGVLGHIGVPEEGAAGRVGRGIIHPIEALKDRFATPAVPPGLSDAATANLGEPVARRGVEKVLRATGMPSGQPGLRESFSIAAPDLAEIEREQPLGESGTKGGIIRPDMRLRQTVDNIDNRLDKLWKEERQPQIDRNAELPALSRQQLLGDATVDQLKRIEKAFKMDIPDQINLGDADKMLVKVNARLRRAEGMTPEARALALELSPDLQKFNEMKGELHQSIGDLLERVNEPGIKEFNRRYGALSEVRDALRTRMNPVEAERVLDSIRATGGLGRNINLFERLHLKASPGRLAQKGLEDLSRSNLEIVPPTERPPLAGLLNAPPTPAGGPVDMGGTQRGGRWTTPRALIEGIPPIQGQYEEPQVSSGPPRIHPIEAPPNVPQPFRTEAPGLPRQFGIEPIAPTSSTILPRTGGVREMPRLPGGKAEIPAIQPAPEAARAVAPEAMKPLEPLPNAKPIMPEVGTGTKNIVPKISDIEQNLPRGTIAEEEATPTEIKGVTEPLKGKTGKAKPTPIEKRFTSEQIADAEGLLRQNAEAMQQGGKAGRQFVEDNPWESTTAAGRNVKKGERMAGRWMTVKGGRDLFPFLRENPKVNPGDIVKALRNKDSAAYRNLVEKAVDFNQRNAPPPDEAYEFLRQLESNPDAEMEGVQEDIGGAEPTFNPAEIEEQAKPKPEKLTGALGLIQAIKEAKQAPEPAAVAPVVQKGETGIIPGMEQDVAKQAEGAAKVSGENLTAEANKPKDITEAAGRIETRGPLFRGTEASPQKEIFGGAPKTETPQVPPTIEPVLKESGWKYEGKNAMGLHTITEPGTNIKLELWDREMNPDFIRRKIAEKEKQYGVPTEKEPSKTQQSTFENKEEGTRATVTKTAKGFAVNLHDIDAGETLPVVKIFPTEEAATAYAKKLTASKPAGELNF